MNLAVVCLFDSLKTRPSGGVRPSLFSLLWRPLEWNNRQYDNIKKTISLTLELDLKRSCKLIKRIQPGPRRRQKSCGTCSGSPPFPPPRCFLLPPSPEILDPSGFSPGFRIYLVCKEILRPIELCGVREGRADHTSYFGLLGGCWGLLCSFLLIFLLLLLPILLLLLWSSHLAVISQLHLDCEKWGDRKFLWSRISFYQKLQNERRGVFWQEFNQMWEAIFEEELAAASITFHHRPNFSRRAQKKTAPMVLKISAGWMFFLQFFRQCLVIIQDTYMYTYTPNT